MKTKEFRYTISIIVIWLYVTVFGAALIGSLIYSTLDLCGINF